MKPVTVVFLLLTLTLPACTRSPADRAAQSLPPIQIHFSPRGGCTDAVVNEITSAKTSILVQAYSFTSAPIAKALVEAHKRGVNVEVILDKSQRTEKYSAADFLVNEGIPARIDAQHAIAHNKIMVIDGEVVITGSFNFTKSAEEENAENLLVIRDTTLAEMYTVNWQKHARHCEAYGGRADKPAAATPSRGVEHMGGSGRELQDGFVASRNSEVFHRPACKSATKIDPLNLVHYATREEAVRAGKKPCSECRP